MKLKLDENLGARCAELLRRAGHAVATTADQGLCGRPDEALISFCQREGRCLISLDLDLGNPLVFDPSAYAGIAAIRLPGRATAPGLTGAVRTLIGGLEKGAVAGKLWIVQPGRIREYQQEDRG